jgi:hypothetical protein
MQLRIYVVFVFIEMGVEKVACCQPDAGSFAKVAVPSKVHMLVHKFPLVVPTLAEIAFSMKFAVAGATGELALLPEESTEVTR